MKPSVVIIGAGLNGLLLAYLLQERYTVVVLEARERIGGRILTVEEQGTHFDLGPTWIWPHQQHIHHLIDTMGLQLFRHYDSGAFAYDAPEGVQYFRSPPAAPSYRIANGAGALTESLLQRLENVRLELNTCVTHIQAKEDTVTVKTAQEHFRAERCIVTLPPRLAANTISFSPDLGGSLRAQMEAIPTWMGFSSKCIVTYAHPFWRDRGFSGFASSHLGPLGEVHDASTPIKGALFGFYRSEDADEPQPDRVVAQLRRLFGEKAEQFELFRYHNWRTDPHTSVVADRAPLREHPRYGLHVRYHSRVHFSGTETAAQEGGYLEGAVIAAFELARRLLDT